MKRRKNLYQGGVNFVFPYSQISFISPIPKKKLLNNILICSKASHIPPQWLLEQDLDTIESVSEECNKILEYEMEYKKAMLEIQAKKMF